MCAGARDTRHWHVDYLLGDAPTRIEAVVRTRAPLLVLHGVNDRRVPVSQARIFRETLEDAGYEVGPDPGTADDASSDFEYRELGEEGHASSDQAQKPRTFRLLADFLDRRVG